MKGIFQLLAGAAVVCTALAAPFAEPNSAVARRNAAIEAKRAELTDIAKRSEIAENAIVWIVLAYSDEQEGADQAAATKHKREALPIEQENDVILLLVSAYSDEAKGADNVKVKAVKRDALPAEQENDIILLLVSAYSDEAEGADATKLKMAKRAIMNKLKA